MCQTLRPRLRIPDPHALSLHPVCACKLRNELSKDLQDRHESVFPHPKHFLAFWDFLEGGSVILIVCRAMKLWPQRSWHKARFSLDHAMARPERRLTQVHILRTKHCPRMQFIAQQAGFDG